MNLWANVYLADFPELENLGPFTSKDGDVLGDDRLLYELAGSKGLKPVLSKHESPSPVIGYLRAKTEASEEILIEVLSSVHGLSPAEIKETVDVDLNGQVFRTLSPIMLLKAKIANCVDLPQDKRQDEKHVAILMICVKAYISEACALVSKGKVKDRNFLAMLSFAKDVVTSVGAKQLARTKGFDFSLCFPAILESMDSERIKNFCKFQLVPLRTSFSRQ